MNWNLKSFLLPTIVAVLLGACAAGPQRPATVQGDDYAYTRSYMQWLIREEMRAHDIAGLSIALVDDQEIVWAEGFGFADRKRRIKATPDTIYRAGSITKLFTATAAMQLDDDGQLDIDASLHRFLPEFSIRTHFPDSAPVTARNIMTHHSGLPSNRHNGMWGDETASVADLVADLEDEYLAAAPDTVGSYSNVAFAVLGHAIERTSGMPYARYIEERILRPLDMQDSYVAPKLRDDERNAKGYFNRKKHETPYLRDLAAGALNTSVVDLARFAQMTFAGGQRNGVRILRPTTLDQMQHYQDGNAVFDVQRTVGLAWQLDERLGAEAGVVASHNGGTPMFFSEFLTLPEQKLAVVVLANSNTAAGIVSKISDKALRLAYESKTGVKPTEPLEFEATLQAREADLERLPGAWSTPMGLARISRRGDRLKFEVEGTKFDLVRREDGHYHLQYRLLGLVPVDLGGLGRAGTAYRNIAGRDLLVIHRDAEPVSVVAEKLDAAPLPPAWKSRLGRYESINALGSINLRRLTLSYSDGLLQARFAIESNPGGDESFTDVLQPVSDRQAVIQGLGRSKGDSVQVVEIDGETLLSYSGFLMRRLD